MLPQLYRPTVTEIKCVTTSAAHRHPELASRLERAAVILEAGDVQLDAPAWEKCQMARWHIASQSNAGSYIVVGVHCPCQDARTKAPVVGGTHFCKHAAAVASYLKILRNHFNQDVRSGAIDLGVLGNGTLGAYAKGLGIVTVARDGESWRFVDHASAVRYSMWLAKRSVNWTAPATELEELAHEEGIKLPMPPDMIAYFESQGYTVDLHSGEVSKVAVELSPNYKALSHLYGLAA